MYERDRRTRRWRELTTPPALIPYSAIGPPNDEVGGAPWRVRVVTRGVAVTLIAIIAALILVMDESGPEVAFSASVEHLRSVVRSLAFEPQGRAVYACTLDGALLTWEPGRRPRPLNLAEDHVLVRRPVFAPNVQTLAVATQDGGVTLWDLAARHRRLQIPSRGGPAMALAFSRDSARLAVADPDGIRLLDAANGEPVAAPSPALRGVSCLAFAPDGQSLAVGGQDGLVWIWRLGEKEPVTSFRAHRSAITTLAFADDGQVLASLSFDGHVARLWQPGDGRLVTELNADSHIQTLVFAPGGRMLATADFGGMIGIWDLESGRRLVRFPGLDGGPLTTLAFSSDGATLACGGTGSIGLYRVGGSESLAHEREPAEE